MGEGGQRPDHRLMAFYPLGARPAIGQHDMTGRNVGNWTCALDKGALGISQPVFEMYHLYLTAPALTGSFTTATVLLNLYSWDVTLIGQNNSWDPSQPMLMTPGDTLYVAFNVPTTQTPPPEITAWFRYST
jgi:hypothetical protein